MTPVICVSTCQAGNVHVHFTDDLGRVTEMVMRPSETLELVSMLVGAVDALDGLDGEAPMTNEVH